MNILIIIFIVFAFVLFTLGTFIADHPRFRFVSAGLAFLTLAYLCAMTGLGK